MIIQKVDEAAKSAGIKATIYGPAGSGKTFAVSTIPEPESVLILSAEAGLMSIRNNATSMSAAIINNIEDMREAFALVRDSGDKYKTVVLDSLSEIAQQILARELGSKGSEFSGESIDDNIKIDGRAAYGNMATRVMGLAKSFRDLNGKNVILVCQEERIQDESGRIYYGPSMPGKKVGSAITYLTDLVFALRVRPNAETGELERRFQTSPLANEMYVAKDRSGALNMMEPPHWGDIFNKING
jgi:hypothetical protein